MRFAIRIVERCFFRVIKEMKAKKSAAAVLLTALSIAPLACDSCGSVTEMPGNSNQIQDCGKICVQNPSPGRLRLVCGVAGFVDSISSDASGEFQNSKCKDGGNLYIQDGDTVVGVCDSNGAKLQAKTNTSPVKGYPPKVSGPFGCPEGTSTCEVLTAPTVAGQIVPKVCVECAGACM